jgi:hypothetical protein
MGDLSTVKEIATGPRIRDRIPQSVLRFDSEFKSENGRIAPSYLNLRRQDPCFSYEIVER